MEYPIDFENKIILGDCLDVMPQIPNKSINLVVADPPYNIGKADWDRIPNYIDWCGKWILEIQRVLKYNGSFYLFHNDMRQISRLMVWIEDNTNFIFKQLITWQKIDMSFQNFQFFKRRLSINSMRNYYGGFTEYCLYFTFQSESGITTNEIETNNFPKLRKYFKEYLVALDLTKKQIIQKVGHKADNCFRWNSSRWLFPTKEAYEALLSLPIHNDFKRRSYTELLNEYEKSRYTFNVQETKRNLLCNANIWNYEIAKRNGHITPKPCSMIENILLHSSNEGDIVLDPFVGSGTTAVGCQNTNRRFIGIEKEIKYHSLAEKQVKEHQK